MELELKDICMSYGKKEVLYHINYKFGQGIYGLLGPNGAGKSTLINILVGLLPPVSGMVTLDGTPTTKLKTEYFEHIGYMPQYAGYYKNFTVNEILDFFAGLKGISRKDKRERIDTLLEYVNMADNADTKIGACSGGMKQRVGIAIALLNRPEIVILDEPTAGLDPIERIRFKHLISDLGKKTTVILSTHIVTDVENIADDVILLSHGKIIKHGSVESLYKESEKINGPQDLEEICLYYFEKRESEIAEI